MRRRPDRLTSHGGAGAAVTSLVKHYPLPAALRTIADAGYQGVEFGGGLRTPSRTIF
jgi:sugar phosphate isomerase/epimerase